MGKCSFFLVYPFPLDMSSKKRLFSPKCPLLSTLHVLFHTVSPAPQHEATLVLSLLCQFSFNTWWDL